MSKDQIKANDILQPLGCNCTGALLEQVFHDVAIEPILQPVTDNNLVPSTANKQRCQIRRKCEKLLDHSSKGIVLCHSV